MGLTVSMIGAGSWGTALSVLLGKKGINVNLWVYEQEVFNTIERARENLKLLPGIIIPQNVRPFLDKGEAINGTEIIIMAVPSQAVRSVAREISPFVREKQIVVNLAKGLEVHTYKRLSQVIGEEIPLCTIAVLSGPSHAEEVARDIPTTVVSSSVVREAAETVRDLFMGPKFRVYTNPDIIGVETGGALKNIIALAAGVSDGLGFGDNTKAALMTRGIVEIARLGEAMGALPQTFAGLTGIGDLIVTCTSMHSRNRRAGIMLGQGKSLDETLSSVGMVVEGVKTCEAAYELSRSIGIEMPITEQLYSILFKGGDPKSAVVELMMRDKTHESEEIISSVNMDWL